MGFLDNLLKKETRKMLSGVMNAVVDNVVDSAKEVLGEKSSNNVSVEMERSYSGGAGSSFTVGDAEEHCGGDVSVVDERISKVLATDFPELELRRAVASGLIGAGNIRWTYTYGIYKNGIPVGMINLLQGHNDYKGKSVQASKQACEDLRIGYVHFILHLPNRTSYIRQQLQKLLAA